MAGGTWIDQNKVRPGVYINYKSAPASLATMGERGVVAIARVLDWGEQGKFYTIEDPSDCAKLGHAITDDEMLFVRQILLGSNRTQGATKILLWNLAQSEGSGAGGDAGTPLAEFDGCSFGSSEDYFGSIPVLDSNNEAIPAVEGAAFYTSPTYPSMYFWVEDGYVRTSDYVGVFTEPFFLEAYAAAPRVVGSINGCSASTELLGTYGDTKVVVDANGEIVHPIDGAETYKTISISGKHYAIINDTYDGNDCLSIISDDLDESDVFTVEGLALGGSGTDGASRASVTIGDLVATALYTGSYGNRLSLSVTAGTGDTFIVQTLLDGQVVDSQTVSDIADLVANQYCSFSGTGAITTTSAPILFTGGANGEPTATAYSDFLNALELQKFDVVIYDGEDATIKGAFIDFVKRLSNREGVKCQAVVSDANNPDNECVINVYPQAVTLTDGTALTPEQLTWWVGGASAGANVFESLTYAAYPDAIEVNPVLTSSQQEDAINAGKFALIAQFDRIQVLTDINSFVTFAVEKGKAFRKNRVIRTIFGLCNDIYRTFATYYIGAVHNDEEGRKALKAEILDLMNRYQGNRALQNVEAEDVTVLKGVDSDAVVIEIYCQPVDSIEKIYINITIS